MTDQPDTPRARCLCLDIETARNDALALKEIGAFRPDTDARLRIAGTAKDLVERLDRVAEGAAFVLGHNVIAFDRPALQALYPMLALHALPLIDTLELSPVAFPQNPYHRLVKDYKLCTTTRNDPVRDAELAYELFLDQSAALQKRVAEHPDEALCLHYLLAPEDGKGVANFFATLRRALRPSLDPARAAWCRQTEGKVCITGQQTVLSQWFLDPTWHRPLAYVLAWLRVAGGNSVLPPWVGLNFPRTREAIAVLRDTPCTDPNCAWCREQHDLDVQLPRYFPGITRFRASPATADGRSLQRAIVENGFAKRPTLAILPTGGGKSLCYQLPALSGYYRNGSLTVVVSPLQSLMKDQVDSLEARGITCAGYLNSLLNPLERRAMLDKLRLGDLGLIFVAPEQFRSTAFTNALMHREIAAWVFDEAHCLSKWGHDFRPDYLYVSRFIRSRQKSAPSPVFCFTATAKPDVVDDICAHFRKQLGMELVRLEGGVSRDNLEFEVRAVPAAAKYGEVLRLVAEALKEEGGAIVFCARQKTVEELASFLNEAGLDCGHFHGGMLPADKRAVQEAFIAGTLRAIAATNAFGMGVDKPDVRLVIHLDTPGSLENYLQEAGRAGRDQDRARCVLLYDEADLDVQFRLLKNARLTQHDIHSILKALRAIEKKDKADGEVVVTSGEILLEVPDKQRLDPDARDVDTKVRIAIAWLEEARLLERRENHIRVFPGSLLVASEEEARVRIARKLDKDANIEPYLRIVSALLQTDDDEGVSTDDLIIATGRDARSVLNMLRELDRWQVLSNDSEVGVTFNKDPDTVTRLDNLARIEDALFARLQEAAPDAETDGWQVLNTRRLCDAVRRDASVDFTPDELRRLLQSFAEPFGDSVAQRGFFTLRPHSLDTRNIKLLRSWKDIDAIRERRMRVAKAVVNQFVRQRRGNQALVLCKQGVLEAALADDLTLADMDIQKWDVALSAALMYLDANEVLYLARGKAIFRAAMTIELNPEARRRQFKKSDYAELALHYKDKIIQVHVMAEYARLALGKIQAAMGLVLDYFRLERAVFIRRYFAGREDVLDMATTEAAHRRILTDLRNPDQQAIVATSVEGNHLVLAGPGAGKTRVMVHRVAWLLRECLVLPDEVMVLAYNRSAALEIRRRLFALIGADATGVQVQTFHGLAMRLTGTSYAVAIERGEPVDFGQVIRDATRYLKRAETDDSDGAGPSVLRDRLLSGLRFLLVDEYQDINGDHYDLISAVAGRTLHTEEDRVSLMVVGDDDQNIYAFDGANVRYIRQFETDYAARRYALIENYRSTRHIVDCANRIIRPARERMKADLGIRVDHVRRDAPAGGELESLDPLARGRVVVLEVPRDPNPAAQLLVSELQRICSLLDANEGGQWGRFAVIARRWSDLEPIANLCRLRGIPARMARDGDQLRLHQTREGNALIALLRGERRKAPGRRVLIRAGLMTCWFRRRYGMDPASAIDHPYRAALAQLVTETDACAPGHRLVVDDVMESLYEYGGVGKLSSAFRPNASLALMTAHRAKGLEFDHVVIVDSGGWAEGGDDERRLFYVAMTRARRTLTVCASGEGHAFASELAGLALTMRPETPASVAGLESRIWRATPEHVALSWPGSFAEDDEVNRAIAALEVGDELSLRRRKDEKGWELLSPGGCVVGRMSSKFRVPSGQVVQTRVHAVMARRAKPEELARVRVQAWEVVLPEIEYTKEDEFLDELDR
jgi:ATP-dependent DNA helicase RecQ